MYKHVSKFTKEIREFSYEGLDIHAAVDSKFDKEDRLLMKEIDKIDETKQVFCSLCKKWVSSLPNNLRNHCNSRGHNLRLKTWKRAYKQFMKSTKERVFNASRPKNIFFKRLLYYRLIHNYEADV